MAISISNIKDALSRLEHPEESPEAKKDIEEDILKFLDSIIGANKEDRQKAKKAQETDYNNLLILSIKHGYKKIVSRLLSGLIENVNISNKEGYSPMHAAIENKDLDTIKMLISKGFSLTKEYNPLYNNGDISCCVHSFSARLANDDRGLEILKYLCKKLQTVDTMLKKINTLFLKIMLGH